jgi:hypothetical protein
LNFVDRHIWERCYAKWGKGFGSLFNGLPAARIKSLKATVCIDSEDCGCRAQSISLTHRKRGKRAFIRRSASLRESSPEAWVCRKHWHNRRKSVVRWSDGRHLTQT